MKLSLSIVALILGLAAPLSVQAHQQGSEYKGVIVTVTETGSDVVVTSTAAPVVITITPSGETGNEKPVVITSSSEVLVPSVTASSTPVKDEHPVLSPNSTLSTSTTKVITSLQASTTSSDEPVAKFAATTPPPTTAQGNNGKRGSGSLTISLTNSYGTPLSVALAWNQGGPGADGNPQPTVLASATSYTFPTGWAGRIAVGKTLSGGNSLIEASFIGEDWHSVDVSYVDGYSVPITCSVAGVAVTGCNIELFNQGNQCQSPVDNGAICHNTPTFSGPPLPFFAPCQGAAYTFPTDDVATASAIQGTEISCCIGTSCPAPSRQKSSKRDVVQSLPHAYQHGRRQFNAWRSSRSHVHQLVQAAKLRR